MRAQLARAGAPGPKAIGIDEISIRKGHTYRIVVSDLIRKRPIWFGGEDRKEASMALFYDWLGEKKTRGIGLAVMDMWKPFHTVTGARAPQAAILFDKFHIMRHLGEALDQVRKTEYARLSGRDRRFIKGQKYTLLSRRENLNLEGRKSLKTLLAANRRLNTAYLLKESFGQLWGYEREGWARRFFENWRASLKWQRLAPYEKFAEMIDRHWDGIAAYCKPENKVSLGFVEGLNNKIRVIQIALYLFIAVTIVTVVARVFRCIKLFLERGLVAGPGDLGQFHGLGLHLLGSSLELVVLLPDFRPGLCIARVRTGDEEFKWLSREHFDTSRVPDRFVLVIGLLAGDHSGNADEIVVHEGHCRSAQFDCGLRFDRGLGLGLDLGGE